MRDVNIKPRNPMKIIEDYNEKSRMIEGENVFEFKIRDGNIYITDYKDGANRDIIVIPSFVYGFLPTKEIIEHGNFKEVGVFYKCSHLKKILGTSKLHGSMRMLFYEYDGEELILENFKTGGVTDMESMFESCGYKGTRKIELGDEFDTSNVKNMRAMVNWCGYDSMVYLNIGNKFDTTNTEDMDGMFVHCGHDKIKKLDLGNKFNTDNAIYVEDMFGGIGGKSVYRNGTKVNLKRFKDTKGKEQ